MTMPHLLVIDDDAPTRRMFARMLAPHFVVESTVDVETALALLYGGEEAGVVLYDAILCDLNLGGSSGRELCEELHRYGHALANRIVIVTGTEPAEDDPFAMMMGERYLVKPCSSRALTATIARAAYPRLSKPMAPVVAA